MLNEQELFDLLNEIPDPEVPAISIVELGVVRRITIDPSNQSVVVTMTPTYSGCPALEVMQEAVVTKLSSAGVPTVKVVLEYAPAWTTDWLTDQTKEKLRCYGIAPPPDTNDLIAIGSIQHPACPYCGSKNTTLKSAFGSTACKALHFCSDCIQPFEEFKAC